EPPPPPPVEPPPPPPAPRGPHTPPAPEPPHRRAGLAVWVIVAAAVAAPFAVIALAFALGGSLAAALPTSFDRLLSRMFWEQLQRSPDRCNGGTAQPYVEAL